MSCGFIPVLRARSSALVFSRAELGIPVAEQFGALPFIYGTVLTSFLALLISVPLGVGAAIFLSELAPPRLSNACTFLVELLAAVPSVILGLAGDLYPRAAHALVCRAVPEGHAGLSAFVPGAGLWSRISRRGRDPGHHDVPVHHLHLARSVAGRSARAARSGAGARRHQVGIHLAGGGAVCAPRNPRLHFPGAGARAWAKPWP